MWLDQEQKDNFNKEPNTLNNPSIGAGSGAAVRTPQIQGSTTAATGTPSSINSAPQSPTRQFGTLQDYFKGNKTQGEQLGEQFTTNLENTKQKQQDTINQAAMGTEQNIASSTPTFNQNVISSALNDPNKVLNDPNQYQEFTKQWDAAYRGPQSFETTDTYSDAAKAAQTAKEKAIQAESTGGRQQLLQDEFGVYGQGNKGLDEALLQQSSYSPKIAEQAKDLSALQNYLASKSQDLGSKIQTAKQTADQTKQQAREEFAKGKQGFETGAAERAMNEIDPANRQLWNAVSTGYADLPGFALNSKDPSVLARYLSATPEERAKEQGLSKLAETPNTFLPSVPDTEYTRELNAILNSIKKK